jgi:transcriptional regulator with XRE-family HTH domain
VEISLGSFLKQFRSKKKMKASDVIKKSNITASLALYSQWENDKKLPSPISLEKICFTLNANKKIAFHLWAQSNMPTNNLKKIFDIKNIDYETILNQPSIESEIFYPAAHTKTIQERDSEFFITNPAAGAILMRCLAAGNLPEGSRSIENLIDDLGITIIKGKTLIQELINRNYIIDINGKYKTPDGVKYIYMPESVSFEKLRVERIKFNCNRLLQNIDLENLKQNKALRINLTNKLSPNQLSSIINFLRTIADDFLKSEEVDDQNYYQVLILVGPEYEKQ